MKVKVQYINIDSHGKTSLGKIYWINRDEKGELFFDEKEYANLSQEEVEFLKINEDVNLYKILEVNDEHQ